MEECFNCLTTNNLEDHHIIFRSQQPILVKSSINIIKLCSKCHRGNEGPHQSRKTDLKYKKALNKLLKNILTHEYSNFEEVQNVFGTNRKQTENLLKTVPRLIVDGRMRWHTESLIRIALGGKSYID